ncbi:OLC1v1030821C1 [Oldenlandia corymbosa var. corymbosa]|uniref:OLC1v1030821C1 n=1 Tax=Oldenlandia corymbosa var. corymbosa TaxID=529605 RepID=A0AAV1CGW7_OLDCO|nr:OLC1v1030821C1 [Oldenlandia corymbosa var. corymbosa]
MNSKVRETPRRRTLQAGKCSSAERLGDHVIVPSPNLNRDERHEVRTRLHNPRDSRIFITEFGWEFFQRHWNRIPIIERKCFNQDRPSTYIDDKQWRGLCNPTTPPRMRVVQELYAYLTVVMGQFVYVRGVTMEISKQAIREVLGLPEVENNWEEAIDRVPP